MRRSMLGLLLFVPLVCCGCESGGGHVPAGFDFVEVTGTVTVGDGRPVRTGAIHFAPLAEGKGREEAAVITDGKFSLKMAAGDYKVAFDLSNPRPSVPAKYTKYDSANLTASVKSGGEPLKFELK